MSENTPHKLVSVGFIARHKTNPTVFAGHGCRAKLYAGPGLARMGTRAAYVPDSGNESAWEILEVFVKEAE
jgi:hypothetical protein